jgi:hypothetical protein
LEERDRQKYIDAGFDAWILKPISFDRLNNLMAAIVDRNIRKECLYQSGQWERGGWFHLGHKSSEEASTKPSGEPPVSNPSREMQEAAHSDDPTAGQGKSTDKRDVEHERLLQNQADGIVEPPPDGNEEPPQVDSKDPPQVESEDPPEVESEDPPEVESEEPIQDEPKEQPPT